MAIARWMRHRTSAVVAAAAVTVLVTACGGGGSSKTKQADANAKVTLQFSQWWAA